MTGKADVTGAREATTGGKPRQFGVVTRAGAA